MKIFPRSERDRMQHKVKPAPPGPYPIEHGFQLPRLAHIAGQNQRASEGLAQRANMRLGLGVEIGDGKLRAGVAKRLGATVSDRLVVGDADGVVVVEREKAASLLPLAARKVADETKRLDDIKAKRALKPGWLDASLRAAGVLKEGETL